MDNALNSREIATLVWLTGGFTWAVWKANAWGAIAGVFRSFWKPIILRSIGAMMLYVVVTVWLLARFDLWEWSNLKTTVVWFVTFVLGWVFNLKRWEADPNEDAKTTLKEVLDATVLVTFLTELYTFNLIAELVLVPIVAFIVLLAAVSEREERTRGVAKFLNGFLAIVGLGLFAYALYQVARDFGGFATANNGREFAVPALLSLMFLPFMYAFNVVAGYETAFMTLGIAVKDKAARRSAKFRAPLAFGLDVMLMRRWKTALFNLDVTSPEDVRSSIALMKAARRRERYPPPVSAAEGWSPYAAIGWLKSLGLPITAYNPSYGEWSGSSPYRQLGGGVLGDSLAYYVKGTATAATILTLKLSFDRLREGDAPESTLQIFSDGILALLAVVFGDAATEVARALKTPGHSFVVGPVTAALVEEDSSMKLVLTHAAHVEPY